MAAEVDSAPTPQHLAEAALGMTMSGVEGAAFKEAERLGCVIGRAEGFAASVGKGNVRPLDLVWRCCGVRARSLTSPWLHARRWRGAALPPTPLPELERRPRFTQHAEFPRTSLNRVLALLDERHPVGAGPTYGFNHDGAERAWAHAEDGIDLQGIADSAVAEGPA